MTTSKPMDSTESLNKDGTVSKMRKHKGNIPTLPQTKACPHCSARFTRSTHLTRHMKTHTNERHYRCTTCDAQFTRSDLLARHRKSCEDPSRPHRLRSCVLCTESKVKCDRNDPCSRCKSRGRDCLFAIPPRKPKSATAIDPGSISTLSGPSGSSSSSTGSQVTSSASTSLLPLDSLISELVDLSTQNDLAPAPALVHSHLSPMYENDVFQPLFNDVFATDASPSADDFPLPLPFLDELPLHTGLLQPWFQELLIFPPNSYPPGEGEQRSLLNDFFSRELQAADPKHYLYLFFNAFLLQVPIVHSATFKFEGKPPYLLKSIKACGALFVKTRKAATYITESLAAAREGLAQAFATTLTDPVEQVHLVLAVVLLQTIGLFHQKPDERFASSLIHGMLVAMIRRVGLISKNSSWTSSDSSIQSRWHEWTFYETTKRALLLSYLHDCCQSIYFGLSPSYSPGEMTLRLPCDDSLWRAGSAEEWFSILEAPSPYQSSHHRLTGLDFSTTFASMVNPQFIPAPNVTSFGYFVLIHAILRDLFAACSETIIPVADIRGDENPTNQKMLSVQHALHNWLHSWSSSRAGYPQTSDEPCFIDNVLPFYWLGQVSILAHQEALPPFNSADNVIGETRFKMVKRWLRRIRAFLSEADGESTLFWDELMKIQLQTWQLEYDTDGGVDDQDGLLGFFPEI
ncbi:fungal-specific transcription factor domain-containing protein [Mycena rosella]|uniref:Fungal-specific transcription factor domain-containing protein n=1 Tax=Mycena rosella TaxID=1033263 RepID=A0AAD7DGC7_MYCRO|nr:fungal-specific transcription factor domain-containing protein [Mycena rosella]